MSGVLITDGLQRKALSVVRSLGRKGINIYVGEKEPLTPAGCSRFCKQAFTYPNPKSHPEEFYLVLLEQIKKTGCEILFPMDDETLDIMMSHREELEELCLLPFPKKKGYLVAADKYETIKAAVQAKVHCPLTYMPKTEVELREVANVSNYPIVIKPRKSSGSRGIRVVKKRADFLALYHEVHSLYPYPMIQEYIPPGDRFDVCLLYDSDSVLRCHFVQKELRHFPIEIGPSTVQESVEYPELVEASKRLADKLNWTSIIEIEYMIDPRNGSPVLMEINPRFWNSVELAIQCNVDFPYYLYKLARKEPLNDVEKYSVGKKVRSLLPGDTLHFLANKKRFQMNPPFYSRIKDDTISLSDPAPTLATLFACVRHSMDRTAWKMMFKR